MSEEDVLLVFRLVDRTREFRSIAGLLPDEGLMENLLQVQEALAPLRPLRLVKIGQLLAPQLLQVGVAFSAVVQLPQDPLADSEDSVALPTTTITIITITITLLVAACSGRHKNQLLELGTLEGAYSAAATREEDLVPPTSSSRLVHSERL